MVQQLPNDKKAKRHSKQIIKHFDESVVDLK